jgi:hypothetical protein
MGDAQQVVDVGGQHHQRHEQNHDELGQGLEQLHQGLGENMRLSPERGSCG